MMPLGTEADLGLGHIVLYCGQTVGPTQMKLERLDQLTQLPRERGTAALPLFLAHVYCGHSRPSQLLMGSCCTAHSRVSSGTVAPSGEYDWTCALFGPSESTIQTARSVQPFWTVHGGNSLYFTMGAPFPQIAPSMWDLDLHLIHGSLRPPDSSTQSASRSVCRFCTAHQCDRPKDWPTHRPTDHTTRSV